MKVDTARFGPLDVREQDVIVFPLGVPGFPAARRFVLVQSRPGSSLRWLQSADDPALAFPLCDPLALAPDYPVARVRAEAVAAGALPDEPIAIAAVLTARPAPEPSTVNLLAPVAIAPRSRLGLQVVLHGTGLPVRHALPLSEQAEPPLALAAAR